MPKPNRSNARHDKHERHERHDKKSKKIYAPVNGKILPLSDLKDPVIAQKLLGEGCAFTFEEDIIFSPCQGTLIMVSNSRHSIGIEAENGDQVLVHLGLSNENQTGQGYHILVSRGQHVHVGQPIMRLDRKYLNSLNIDLTLAVVVTNRDPSHVHVSRPERVTAGRAVVMERV